MSGDEDRYGILDDTYRAHMTAHYQAIAEEMHRKRLLRAPWRIEIDGVVYKFKCEAYAKRGSERWKQLLHGEA